MIGIQIVRPSIQSGILWALYQNFRVPSFAPEYCDYGPPIWCEIRVLPSRLTVRHPRYHAPRVRRPATGPTSSLCNRCTGSLPSRERASEMPASPATWIGVSGPAIHLRPSSRHRSTSRADDCMYIARATTKDMMTWAGNARCRTLALPVASNTSRMRSGGKV